MASVGKEESKIIVGLIAIFGLAYLFFLTAPPWDTHGSALAYHSVLGFLSILATAAAINRFVMDPSPSHRVFLAAMGFLATVHLGAAVIHLFGIINPVAHTVPKGVLVDIIEMLILSMMLFVASYLNSDKSREWEFWRKRSSSVLLLVVSLVAYGLSNFIPDFPGMSTLAIWAGYIIGSITILIFASAIYFILKREERVSSHDKIRLFLSSILFILSTAVFMMVLASPNRMWSLSIAFQIGALIFIVFAVGYPFLLDVGLQEKIAYSFLVALTALAVLPFIIAQIVEVSLPLSYYEDPALGIILHISAALFSAITGYILNERIKDKSPWYDGPAIFALFSWTIIESVIIIIRVWTPQDFLVESLFPYIAGGVITSFALLVALQRTLRPPQEGIPEEYSSIRPLSYILVAALALLIEVGLAYLPSIRQQAIFSQATSSLLLIFSYAAFLTVSIFVMFRAAQSGGLYSVEIVGISSLALWTVSMILRVNFSVWTAGWWAAEFLLFIFFLIMPILIAGLYIEKYHLGKHLTTASMIYDDLMVSELDQHHDKALDSLGDILRNVELDAAEMDRISTAMAEISQANEAAERFDIIIKGQKLTAENSNTIDLHDALQAAFERLGKALVGVPKVEATEVSGDCRVAGSTIVVDLFRNLLRGVLTRVHANFISVEISKNEEMLWNIRITIETDAEVDRHTRNLIRRYLSQVRKGNLEFQLVNVYERLLGASVVLEAQKTGDPSDAVILLITIPDAASST